MNLKQRVLSISYKNKLSHLGSCLTALPIIDKIYELKESGDHFVLDNGHAGLAQYVVLEKYNGHNAEDMLKKMGIHPEESEEYDIDVSSGSLGLAGSIALGMAMVDPLHNVYVLTSDGSLREGIWWETLRNAVKFNVTNYKLLVNFNGFSGIEETDLGECIAFLRGCGFGVLEVDTVDDIPEAVKLDLPLAIIVKTNLKEYPVLLGVDAHYKVLNEEEYKSCVESSLD